MKPCHDAAPVWEGKCARRRAHTEASPLAQFPTYMAYSMNPLGPFSTPVMIYLSLQARALLVLYARMYLIYYLGFIQNGSDGGGTLINNGSNNKQRIPHVSIPTRHYRDTNMAGVLVPPDHIVIFADGSLVGMWRGDRKSFDVKPDVSTRTTPHHSLILTGMPVSDCLWSKVAHFESHCRIDGGPVRVHSHSQALSF